MTSYDKSQRAPDIKAVGLAVFVGVMLARAEKASDKGLAMMALAGIGCYLWGIKWE